MLEVWGNFFGPKMTLSMVCNVDDLWAGNVAYMLRMIVDQSVDLRDICYVSGEQTPASRFESCFLSGRERKPFQRSRHEWVGDRYCSRYLLPGSHCADWNRLYRCRRVLIRPLSYRSAERSDQNRFGVYINI